MSTTAANITAFTTGKTTLTPSYPIVITVTVFTTLIITSRSISNSVSSNLSNINLNNVLRYYQPRQIIRSNKFSCAKSFTFVPGFNLTYYVIDGCSGYILLFDKNWNYLSFVEGFVNAKSINAVNTNIYITFESRGIIKTDENLIEVYNYQSNQTFTGMLFNSSSQTIYIASTSSASILEFTTNLDLVSSFSSGFPALSLQIYENNLYVSTVIGQILIFLNKVLIGYYSGCDSLNYSPRTFFATSMIFDNYGYMAIYCDSSNYHYIALFSTNVTYLNLKLQLNQQYPSSATFDAQGRLVVISPNEISIFY